MRKILLFKALLLTTLPIAGAAQVQTQAQARRATQRPRLVVNMVVGGLSYDLLERFSDNLSEEGFARFAMQGLDYRSASYGYMQTISPAGLATLTTGVDPSMHGVVSSEWIDYVTGESVSLIDDRTVQGIGTDPGEGRYSGSHLVMPTLGDKLLASSPESKVVSIASIPQSAVVMAGQTGKAWWMDEDRATWVSSTAYMGRLPEWAAAYNEMRPANNYIDMGWTPARMERRYLNFITNILHSKGEGRIMSFRGGDGKTIDYTGLLRSPHGNTLVADFARRVVENEQLGRDDAPDILNICFDASRDIIGRYGPESMEVEDMIYRLDMELYSMVRYITSQVEDGRVVFVVTSDHGMSEAWDAGYRERERFNVSRFKTLLGSFLGVQFGPGDWVAGYIDRQVYFDHNLIFKQGLSLTEVQNRAATFVLQFRGVSHVLTSTALTGSYFGEGYGHRMQKSFYPRRGGDLVLNLMPGWIEERPETKSLSGSMYDYDTRVPLIVFGWKVPARTVSEPVDMTRLAPTLAHILGIGRPVASDADVLPDTDAITR